MTPYETELFLKSLNKLAKAIELQANCTDRQTTAISHLVDAINRRTHFS